MALRLLPVGFKGRPLPPLLCQRERHHRTLKQPYDFFASPVWFVATLRTLAPPRIPVKPMTHNPTNH